MVGELVAVQAMEGGSVSAEDEVRVEENLLSMWGFLVTTIPMDFLTRSCLIVLGYFSYAYDGA